MADYLEIRKLFNDDTLINRVTVAAIIAANNLLSGTPTAADKAYASAVFANPRGEAGKILMSVLAANNSATVSQILGSSDASIQTNVDLVVPLLVDALAGV